MEISKITNVERIVSIAHPATGEPIGLSVRMVSIEDVRMKKITRRLTDQALALRQRGKTFTAEQIEKNKLDLITASITGWTWEGETTFHGKKPEYSVADFHAVVSELSWILTQLDAELGDTKSFFTE